VEPVNPTLFQEFAIALGLGLLVGVQRERAASAVAGVRTFALVTWLGSVVALLSESAGGWLVGAGLVGVAALALVGHLAKSRRAGSDAGITTEVAVLLMYLVGALVVLGDPLVAVVLTGGISLLLHWKDPLHAFARRIGEEDFSAMMRFVLIALVVLPVLPDRPMGPYGVLNPFHVWLMVVLIFGIGLSGYVAYKLAGPRFGPLLGGVFGGLVSSTATAASFARRAKAEPGQAALCAVVIAIASAVVFARVLLEVAAVAPSLLSALALPLGIVGGAALLAGLALARGLRDSNGAAPELGNPAELAPALVFAVLYAAALVAFAFVRERFGEPGVYGVAFLGGLTDVDAITLSTARLSLDGRIAPEIAWRAILLAALANLLFKAVVVAALGPAALLRRVGLTFMAPLVLGAAVLLFWPS
jgi:uncharacterized membrane protein (DUF4010 family)